jgi:hypothetical protein
MPMISARLALQSAAGLARSGLPETLASRPPLRPGGMVRSRRLGESVRAHPAS